MRKKKGKVVKENSERWLLTYSDLITLLMIFFIILYSMSTIQTRKFDSFTGALRAAFNNGAFQVIEIGGSPGHKGSGPQPGPAEHNPSEQKTYKKLKQVFAKLSKELGLQQKTVHVGLSKEGIVVTLSGSLLFYPDDIVLLPQSSALLDRIAIVVRNMPNKLRIEGNTDNQTSPNSVYTSPWKLSSLRADSIVEHFQKIGVAGARLEAMGLGATHPIASNATAEGRARNRRVDIVILYP